MGNFTPGPWKLDGGEGKRGELYVWSDRAEKGKGFIGTHEICVAVVKPNARCEGGADFAEEEIAANARLMASAPDLLAALERALPLVQLLAAKMNNPTQVADTTEAIFAALAKATGK